VKSIGVSVVRALPREPLALIVMGVVLSSWPLVPVANPLDGEGWAEVVSTRPAAPIEPGPANRAATEATPGYVQGVTARSGDRLWMSRDGDTFASIARRTTGSDINADAIARYNARSVDASLPTDTVLYIPVELSSRAMAEPAPVAWEIREYAMPERSGNDAGDGVGGADRVAPAPGLEAGAAIGAEPVTIVARKPAVQPLADVNSERLDLFAGEVSVLGEVSVTRVAIGNGDIVRAEVLGSGELLVIAQTEGSSSLRLWHSDGRQSDYNIRVSASDPEIRVRMERMVRMRVRMVEFRKSALGRLGIDWADSTSGPGFAAAGDVIGNNLFRPATEGFSGLPNTVQPFSTYFGIASNITSRINFLASNGDATTLAEPVLTAANGGAASFLAGGEVPYPSVGTNGQTVVQFKEYGIKLDVAPRIDSAGNVRAVVKTEISQLDPAVSVQGAPGLLTRRAETEVNVRSGETIVISGLLSSESSKDLDRLPGIGRLPVIGAFFRSTNRRDAVTELVIFVTPEVVDPANPLLEDAHQRRFDASSDALQAARATLPLLD